MAVSPTHNGFRFNHLCDQLEILSEGTTLQIFKKDNHSRINTNSDTRNVRINSRNYTQTSGDASGVQIKPNQTAATASITGLEVSPRFASAIAGTNLVAIKADPVLKGTTGNIGGQVTGVQVNIDFGISGSRCITGDVSAFETFLAVPSSGMTYSGRVAVMRVRTVNIKAWDDLFNFDDANTGAAVVSANGMNKDPCGCAEAGFLTMRVAGTSYQIPFYCA